MVGRAFRLQLPEEPLTLLSEGQCQRLLPIGKRYRRDRIRRAFQSLGERFQNRPLEQRLQACVQLLLLANPRNHPGSQQRMTAQFEEVVVQANPFHSQDLRPDRCDALLQLDTLPRDQAHELAEEHLAVAPAEALGGLVIAPILGALD